MAWVKLDNPKPNTGAAAVPPMVVRVRAREAPKRLSRYIVVSIGYGLADKARFIGKEHRCHIMAGSGADDGKVAITMDDQTGKFTARRRADGRYEVTITAHAAAGKFSTAFPPFERAASVQNIPGMPPVVVFDGSADFLRA